VSQQAKTLLKIEGCGLYITTVFKIP